MSVPSQETSRDNTIDKYPLLMERPLNHESQEHVIDMERGRDASPSGSCHNDPPHGLSVPPEEVRPSSSARVPITQSTSNLSNGSNTRSSSLTRRGEGSGRRNRSPFNTLLWLSIELVFTLGQIVAAIVVLLVSQNEKPRTPLFIWIMGYAAGCAASLPILYWRYLHRIQGIEQGSPQIRQGSSQGNSASEPNSYINIALARSSDEEDVQNPSRGTWNSHTMGVSNARFNSIMDHFKMALDCFFAVWFVVGNVWIFGGHSSSADAPNLYRLCIVFLTFSCIGYAMPFILCALICCCLPCIISILGVRDDINRMRGASEEIINALPTYTFKLKKNGNSNRMSNSGVDEGGFIAVGTAKERAISGEDALCCICLAKYADNDELRELPCTHFFHTECVDKWLKINASCPLCKFEIGESNENLPTTADSTQQT